MGRGEGGEGGVGPGGDAGVGLDHRPHRVLRSRVRVRVYAVVMQEGTIRRKECKKMKEGTTCDARRYDTEALTEGSTRRP